MSYTSNIPQAASKRVISQRQIQANFTAIFNAFAKNHSPLGPPDTQGKHNMLILRPQAVDPATSANQTAIYNKIVATIPNLFYRPNNNQFPIQMTYPSIKVGLQSKNPDVYFAEQQTFVPGPFVFYAGKIPNPNNNQLVTLIPATTLRYVGLSVTNFKFTGSGIPSSISVAIPTNISGNSFNISYQNRTTGVTFDIYYIAIGN